MLFNTWSRLFGRLSGSYKVLARRMTHWNVAWTWWWRFRRSLQLLQKMDCIVDLRSWNRTWLHGISKWKTYAQRVRRFLRCSNNCILPYETLSQKPSKFSISSKVSISLSDPKCPTLQSRTQTHSKKVPYEEAQRATPLRMVQEQNLGSQLLGYSQQGTSLSTQVDTGAEAQGQESPFNIEVGNDAEVDGGWILIQSSSLSPLDCLPPNTYFLVPVAEVARLGALLAAGPNGNNLIQVCAQGAAARLMRKFRVRGSSVLHNFTANHPLRVMRSGNWIQEHASTLQVGDVLDTVSGLQEIESTSAPEMSSEEVFSLDVQDGGEAYVFTPTQNADGQLSWSGVAVLGSMKETQERSRSAPPQLRSEMPSKGSWQCKDRERCSNICRKFLKGKCSEGSHCRFCHRPHPEESTRQPRGPRETGSSGSSRAA